MFDKRMQQLKDHFGIATANDWLGVRPEWILSQDGCGPRILEYIRLLLANQDLTLKEDRTPEYWKLNRGSARVVECLGNEQLEDEDGGMAAKDRGIIAPFTILIDTAESHPFTFQNFRTSAAEGNRPLIVPTAFQSLGRFPESFADYSLDSSVGGYGRCHVERKSMEDAHSTILGWARKGEDIGRRDRFIQELERLSEIEAGLVVIECTYPELIARAPQWGIKTAAQNSVSLENSILSWNRKYQVQWRFAGDRRNAERLTFKWIKQWHDAQMELRKAEMKEAAKRRRELLPVAATQVLTQPLADFDLSTI